ncbi:MAG TPA: hypothetical protein VNO30_45030 [Kofleriaceae bacterium]|nr:hypothetical protein [Kofleriaceae bacterium]
MNAVALVAQDDVGWLVVRQPAVVRLLERELAAPDGDAFEAGVLLARRVLGGPARIARLRIDHNALNSGLAAVRSGRCDRAMVRSVRDQVEELPGAVLTPYEQDAVATTIAALLWAILDLSMRDDGELDALVA